MLNNISLKPFSFFNHKYAFLPNQFEKNEIIKDQLEILATVFLENNQEIVAMIKHKEFPFFGTQFHPEKIQYEHKSHLNKV